MWRTATVVVAAGCAMTLSLAGTAVAVWTSTGPLGGNVRAAAIDPSVPSTMYVGTSSGGFFKSVDGGLSWNATSGGVSNLGGTVISGLAVDPTASARVYATADVGVNQGVFRSTDGGATWSFTPLGFASGVAVDPATPSTVYVSGVSVHKSVDSGANWSAVLAGGSFFSIAIDPSVPSTVYAGASSSIYKSTDSGANWTLMGGGLQAGEPVLALAVHPTNSAIVYVGQEDGGVRKSVDGGVSFTALGPIVGSPPFENLSVSALAIDQDDPDTVYAGGHTVFGGFSVYKTVDGGANWSNTPLTSLVVALAISPSPSTTLIGGTADGVARTTDGAASWNFENTGLVNTAVDSVVLDATPGTVYSGTLTDRVVRSTDGGVSWTDMTPVADLRTLASDPVTPGTLYAGSLLNGAFKSTNGGGTWTPLVGGAPPANVEALLVDPTATNIVYAAGFGGVFRSTIGGGSWTQINTGLSLPVVVSLAIDPSAPDTLYAGIDPLMGPLQGVFKTTNAGGMWAPASTGIPSITGAAVTALVVDPVASTTVYAGIETAGVYKTIDGGTSWASANAGLTSGNVTALALDAATGTLYAATLDQGVFISLDAGASWNAFNAGLYNLSVNALAVEPTRLYAGSGGNGTFVMPLDVSGDQAILGKTIVIKDPTPPIRRSARSSSSRSRPGRVTRSTRRCSPAAARR